jgi:hypothetical protein
MGSKLNRAGLVVALAVTFAVAYSAVGLASSSHKVGHTLKVFSVETAVTEVDVDGDGAFSVGDEVIGQAKDYNRAGGTQIGTGSFVCVAIDVAAGDFDCQGSDILQGGEIREAGVSHGTDPIRWAITGGTGAYLGAGGQLEGAFIDPEQTQANFTFTFIRQ